MKKSATFRKLNIRSEYRKNDKFRFAMQVIGVLIGAMVSGMIFPTFYVPANIIPSGLSGIALLIAKGIGHPELVTVVYLIMNVILFLIALKLFGWRFVILTLIGIGGFSLAMQFFKVPVISTPNVEEFPDYRILYCFIGAGIAGAGQGLAFRMGGSTGGSDIAANIINKFAPKIKTGVAVLIINIIVITITVIVEGWQTALYAVIVSVVSTITCDMVLDGKKTVKAFYIICDKEEEVANAILKRFSRGVTLLNAQGMFSKKEKKMLLCLVASNQAREMKEIVKDIDKNAFVFSTSVSETVGDGNFLKEASIIKHKIQHAPTLTKLDNKDLRAIKERPKKSFGKKFSNQKVVLPSVEILQDKNIDNKKDA